MTIEISPLENNDAAAEIIETSENIPSEPPPLVEAASAKSRGRPKGSLNRKKVIEPSPELPPPPPPIEVVPEKKKTRERKHKPEIKQEQPLHVQASESIPSPEDIHRARLFEIHDRARSEMERRQARYTHMLNSRISSF
jgi:hypothetical protein